MTYRDLQSILDKSFNLMTSANAVYTTVPLTESLALRRSDLEVKIGGHGLNDPAVRLPAVSTELRYTASVFSRDAMPVTSVSLHLTDASRFFSVDGQSAEQVDALYALLKDDLLGFSSRFGGGSFRLLLVSILFAFSFSMIWVPVVKAASTNQPPRIPPILVGFVGIGIWLAWLIMPPVDGLLSEVFAGFSVSDSHPSFLYRNAPLLTLSGFLLAVLTPITRLLVKAFSSSPPTAIASKSEDPVGGGLEKRTARQRKGKRPKPR